VSWFYSVKVNIALDAMGVPPNHIKGKWRSGMQQIGKAAGLTPQETALVIVGYGLGVNCPADVKILMGVWRDEGKISLTKPEVIEAIHKMGFSVFSL
jgi:hypothetical protein